MMEKSNHTEAMGLANTSGSCRIASKRDSMGMGVGDGVVVAVTVVLLNLDRIRAPFSKGKVVLSQNCIRERHAD